MSTEVGGSEGYRSIPVQLRTARFTARNEAVEVAGVVNLNQRTSKLNVSLSVDYQLAEYSCELKFMSRLMFAEVVVVFCGRVGTCTGDEVRPYRRFTDRRIAKF